MTPRLDAVLVAIDAANAADPTSNRDSDCDRPAALVYGERMSAELARLFPDASEALAIAARGQHIERWRMARASFPEGRAGYLAWRTAQAASHADRVGGIMAAAGYGAAEIDTVARLLRKEGIKRNPETQRLEDVICFVFLRWYFADFAAKHEPRGHPAHRDQRPRARCPPRPASAPPPNSTCPRNSRRRSKPERRRRPQPGFGSGGSVRR